MIEYTIIKEWPYQVWSQSMIQNYNIIDKWCYMYWGKEGDVWKQAEVGWLFKDYNDAVFFILIWDQ